MRRYESVSGIVFAVLATAQLVRVLFRWPVQIASVSVPLWTSGLAIVIAGSLAVWAFRSSAALRPR